MHRFGKRPAQSAGLLLLMLSAGAALAQPQPGADTRMEGCMMMGGWGMAVSILLTALLIVLLILGILAPLKYLFGKKT